MAVHSGNMSPEQEGEELGMRRLASWTLVAGALIAGVVVAYQQSAAQLTWSVRDAAEAAGRHVFADHCAACHVKQPGSSAVLAPTLIGVLGRPAGSVVGFPYSDALKNSGLTWTEDNLRKWVADNAHMVPNTLMPHVSISDPAEQIYVVTYLKTLTGPATP
jgi:cytochrome c